MATRKRPTNPPDPVGPPAPTTTTPPASPTTTVPAQPATGTSTELAAAMALILQQYPWLANAEENRLRAIGQNSVKVLDEQGKLIRYEGLEKTLPSGEQVAPQYYQGDEYSISTWTTEDIRDYQNKLIAGGFFSGLKKPTVLGVVTPDTITAYNRLLETANLSFINADEALARSKDNPYNGGGSGLQRYRVTSSTELQQVFDKAAQSVLGRSLDPEQVAKLTKTYQDVELGARSGAEQAPSAAAFGMERVEQQNQDEADAYKFASYAQVFEKLLGS